MAFKMLTSSYMFPGFWEPWSSKAEGSLQTSPQSRQPTTAHAQLVALQRGAPPHPYGQEQLQLQLK